MKGIGKNKVNPFHGRLPAPSPPRPLRQTPRTKLVNDTVDPLPEFVLQVNSEFEALVNPLRGHSGEIKVRLEFGRIILKDIPRTAIARYDTTKSLSVEEILKILKPVNGVPHAYFTNVLTTVPSDIHFILDMKNHSGQKMWNTDSTPAAWRVIYEFICHHQGALMYLPTSLEVHGNTGGSQRRLRQKRDFGHINVHGTKRQWDFRIAAAGYEIEDNIEPLYKRLGEEVSGSLYV